MPELVRDDACRETGFMTDLMKIIAELSNERLFAARSRQEEAILGKPFQGTKEAQPLDEFADERIDRNQSFGFQFAERDMDGPLVRTSGTEAVDARSAHSPIRMPVWRISKKAFAPRSLRRRNSFCSS